MIKAILRAFILCLLWLNVIACTSQQDKAAEFDEKSTPTSGVSDSDLYESSETLDDAIDHGSSEEDKEHEEEDDGGY